eukprot:g43917.t1
MVDVRHELILQSSGSTEEISESEMDTVDLTASMPLPPEEKNKFLPRCSRRKRRAADQYAPPISEPELEELDLVQKRPRSCNKKMNRPTSPKFREVPIPMFLPTTLDSADKIVEAIEELKVKIPSNPFEADILAMAEMIAEAEEMEKASSDLYLASNPSADGLLEDCDLFGPARDDVLAMAVKMANVLDEPGQDLEADFPKTPLELNSGVDFLFDCGIVTTDEEQPESEIPRAVRRGQKRLMLSESCSRDSLASQQCCTGLNYSYGVNAWKSWLQAKYASGDTSKSEELRFG